MGKHNNFNLKTYDYNLLFKITKTSSIIIGQQFFKILIFKKQFVSQIVALEKNKLKILQLCIFSSLSVKH